MAQRNVRYSGSVWQFAGSRSSLCGTELAYDATRCAVLTYHMMLRVSGTDLSYDAERCAVLTYSMMQRGVRARGSCAAAAQGLAQVCARWRWYYSTPVILCCAEI
eukprot:1751888-Rhodomonas_salina.1